MHAKRTALVLAVLASLALPASSTAAEDLRPTVAELQWSRSVAVAYWHVQQPPCGREIVLTGSPPNEDVGLADWSACSIIFSEARDWRDYPEKTCEVYVHEFGHLVLGPTYFAAVNPADPAHSPDASNIMYGNGNPRTTRQEDAVMRSVGCLPPATAHHRRHAKRRRHR